MSSKDEIRIYPNSQIIANTGIDLQEEDDKWGILYNPATDFSFGVNPVSVFIWKQLKTKSTFKDIVNRVRENCVNVPVEVEEHVSLFINQLFKNKFVTVKNN